MTYMVATSKSGVDVATATDPNDFIFHSSYNTFKIIAEGTYSPTLGVSVPETSTSSAHGQSYTPFVFVFCEFADGRVGGVGNRAAGADFWFTRFTVDATNMNFYYINNTGGNYSPVFKYYIVEMPL